MSSASSWRLSSNLDAVRLTSWLCIAAPFLHKFEDCGFPNQSVSLQVSWLIGWMKVRESPLTCSTKMHNIDQFWSWYRNPTTYFDHDRTSEVVQTGSNTRSFNRQKPVEDNDDHAGEQWPKVQGAKLICSYIPLPSCRSEEMGQPNNELGMLKALEE